MKVTTVSNHSSIVCLSNNNNKQQSRGELRLWRTSCAIVLSGRWMLKNPKSTTDYATLELESNEIETEKCCWSLD